MKKPLAIVTTLEIKKERIDFVKSELLKLIEPSRKIPGCISYRFHQCKENSDTFTSYENWASQEALLLQMESKHIRNFMSIASDSVKTFTLTEMHELSD